MDFERLKDYCQKFSWKNKKTFNLEQKCFWVICRLEFWRTIVTFDVNTSEYVIKWYFMQNKQFSNLKPKMSCLCSFGFNSQIYQNTKLCTKVKILKLGPKKSFLSIFRLKSDNVIFEIITLEFFQTPKIELNSNVDNSSSKKWNQKCLICVFWPINLKNYCYIWKQYLRICQNPNNCSKQRKTKKKQTNKKKRIWNKNVLFDILDCKFEKLLIYLKSAPLNLSKCKVLCKNKNS